MFTLSPFASGSGGSGGGSGGGIITEYIEPSTDTLTADQCAGGVINNYGQSGNVVLTLPACTSGMSFRFIAGSAAAFYLRFDPNASDKIYLDGVAASADGKYVGEASVTIGDSLTFEAFQSGAGVYDWNVTSGLGSWALEA